MEREKQQPCCPCQSVAKAMKLLTFPDGSQVGILNLDTILREVAELKLTDDKNIKKELLKRVANCNYVPTDADYDYSTALFREYRRQFEGSK